MKFSIKTLSQPLFNLMLVIAFGISATNVNAQQVLQKIEAIVNDEIISGYDLTQRVNLVLAASGAERNPEELAQVNEQVLRSMVDERLQLQEAAEYEVEIETAQIDEAYVSIASNFQQTPEQFEQFLINAGSSKKSLYDQLRAEFSWQAMVNGRLGGQVSISDEEVDERIQRIIANTGKYEYRVAEIYLIVDNPSRRSQVRETADRLFQQINRGAQFYVLAQQFSETSTASAGGDMGWVSEDQLSREIKDVVSQMSVGQVSIPIFSGSGYYILSLLDRRRILSVDPMDVEVKLHNLFYPTPENITAEEAEAWIVRAENITDGVNSCDQIPAVAEQLGITEYGQVADLPLRQLNPRLKPLLVDLETGHISTPVLSEDGIRFFAICEKTVPEITQPSFDQVFYQLEQERLALMARRYLRDLRRDSVVDYK